MGDTAKFAASFRGSKAHDSSRSVRISRIAKARASREEHNYLDEVTVHTSVPASPSSFLQIWEADHFSVHYTMVGEAPKTLRKNRLIASIPGAVVKRGQKYTFVLLDAAKHKSTFDGTKGHITLQLEQGDGVMVDSVLPLPAYEGVLELIGIVKAVPKDDALSTLRHAKPHQVHNVGATVLSQIRDRGGLHMSFVADYDFKNASNNDKEFRRQAEAMIAQLPSLTAADGRLAFGLHEIDDWRDMAGHIDALRSTAQSEFDREAKPPIGSLAIYAHGVTRGVRIADTYDDKASPSIRNVEEFVSSIRDHLSASVVVTLYSCNAGRGGGVTANHRSLRSKKEALKIYGRVGIGEELGGDSFAWHLFQELQRQGIPNPTVWAHTIAKHTTRNRRKRVFSTLGIADLPSILYGVRYPDDKSLKAYLKATNSTERQNLLRMVSLCHGMYLDWNWLGDEADPQLLPAFSEVEHARVRALITEIRDTIVSEHPDAGGARTPTVDIDASGRFIRRALDEGPGITTPLSDDFNVEAFAQFDDGLPIPIDLVRKLQMLRYRSQKNFSISGVVPRSDAGVLGVRIRVQEKDADAVEKKAKAMIDEGLFFTSVSKESDTELELRGPEIPGPS